MAIYGYKPGKNEQALISKQSFHIIKSRKISLFQIFVCKTFMVTEALTHCLASYITTNRLQVLLKTTCTLNLPLNSSLYPQTRENYREHIKYHVSFNFFLIFYHCLGARIAQDALSSVSIHLQPCGSCAVMQWHQAKLQRSYSFPVA